MASASGAAASEDLPKSMPDRKKRDIRSEVLERDALVMQEVQSKRRKLRKDWAHAELVESKSMKKEDVSSDLFRAQTTLEESERISGELLREAQELLKKAAMDAAEKDRRPPPKFRVGQSVHVYWASWFPGCPPGDAPTQLARKMRPSWYSSEIVTCLGWKDDLPYGGALHSGYAYVAH